MRKSSEIIEQIIKRKDIDNKFKLIDLCKNWDRILGQTLSKMAKPIGSKGTTLFIGVEDSILMQELSFYSSDILEKINKFFGNQPFDKIKYKLLEDRTPLDIVVKELREKRSKYNVYIPNKVGKLINTIPENNPVYRAYKSYIKLIAHIKKFKEEYYNG